MEEKIKELERKVEVLSGVVFIILRETGLLEKALSGNIAEAIKKAKEEKRTQQDKFESTHKEGEYNSILEEFDSKEAIKN